MMWVSWRRQRAQLITLLAMLLVGGGAIALLRSNMIDTIDSLRLTPCVTQKVEGCSDGRTAALFEADWATWLSMGQAAILCLPVLIGVFVGAPLFARELEHGTHVLAFTQSVSRTRWALSKIVVALAPALIVLAGLQYLISWWLSAAGLLGPRSSGSFYFLNFGIEHASPVAYALFAFALGTFAGVVSRRTLAAMVVCLGVFVVLRVALSERVGRLVSSERLGATAEAPMYKSTKGSLVFRQGWLDATGQQISLDRQTAVVQACRSAQGPQATQDEYLACLRQSGLVRQFADIVPESRAWQVHLVDASIYGGLAILLLVGTVWVLRRQS